MDSPELHFPWIEACIGLLLVGSVVVSRVRSADAARRFAMAFASVALVLMGGMYLDFRNVATSLSIFQAHDGLDGLQRLFGPGRFIVDNFSAPLMPLTAMVFLLTTIATLRTKIRRFSFALTLVSEAIVLATFSCNEPWGIIALMAAAAVPPYLEMKAREKPTRVYVLHMTVFLALLALGWGFVEGEGRDAPAHSLWVLVPLLLAVFIRSGVAPFHCWMTDLFENATFGTALLYVTPLPGAYVAVRLVLPIAPDWVMHSLGVWAMATAVYAAGMALVQKEARRFFCYIFLSHSALVLVGLDTVTALGLTGALVVWLSVGLALSGFGLTMRALESRHGRLSLTSFRGIYEHTPALAICFLLTGLASVGFPGTFGFIGMEMLVDAAVQESAVVGVAVVIAAALNGIAIVKAYFLLFTGTRHASPVSLRIGKRERFAVLALASLILFGGLFPQYGVFSRFLAADHIVKERERNMLGSGAEATSAAPH